MKRFVVVILLSGVGVLVLALFVLLATPAGVRAIVTAANYWVGDDLSIVHARGTVLQGITIDKINYHHEAVTIVGEQLFIRWDPVGIVTSTLAFKQLSVGKLQIQLPAPAADAPPFTTADLVDALPSLAFYIEEGHVTQFNLRHGASPARVLENVSLRIRNSRRHLHVHALDVTIPVNDHPLNLHLSGYLKRDLRKPLDATVQWRYDYSDQTYAGTMHASGTLEHLTIAQTLTQPIALQGKFTSTGTWESVHITGQLANADPALPFQITLDAHYAQNSVRFTTKTQFKHAPTPGDLSLDGKIDHLDSKIQMMIEGSWHHLPLPIHLATAEGNFKLQGTLDDYRMSLTTSIAQPEQDTSYWQLVGAGNQQQLRLSTVRVQWQDNTVRGPVTIDWQAGVRWQGTLQSVGATAQDVAIKLTSKGSLDAHTLALHVQHPTTDFSLAAKGAYQDGKWQGTISDMALHSKKTGHWRLVAPAEWVVGPEHRALSLLCLQAGAAQKSCVDFDWQPSGYHAQIDAQKLPLQWLVLAAGLDVRAQGTLDVHAKVQGTPKTVQQGVWRVRLSPGQLAFSIPDAGRARPIIFRGGTLDGKLVDADLQGQYQIALEDKTPISGDFKLPGIAQSPFVFAKQPIHATLRADLLLAHLAPLFADIRTHPQGRLVLDLSMTGTLANPRLQGSGTVRQGRVNVPDLGIAIEKINLTIKDDTHGNLGLQGTAQLGTGTLQITGRVHWQDKKGAEIQLSGKNLEIMNTDQAHIFINPDLTITLANKVIDIKGEVLVPKAALHPTDTRQVVKPSSDVVRVLSKKDKSREDAGYTLHSTIKLILGDEVTFAGFDLTTQVKGQLQIIDRDRQPARATGELQLVEGEYHFHGNTLTIKRGRLLFVGGLLTNPGLDIRAEREVNIQTSKDISLIGGITSQSTVPGLVWVHIQGTINKPQMVLFSDPPVSEADRLSYLVLGIPSTNTTGSQGALLINAFSELSSSMGFLQTKNLLNQLSHATGIDTIEIESSATRVDPETSTSQTQTSLVLGKALTPRLRVRYSIGLLDPINIFTLRFQLTNHLLLQAETSSVGQSGGDLLYQIELGE